MSAVDEILKQMEKNLAEIDELPKIAPNTWVVCDSGDFLPIRQNNGVLRLFGGPIWTCPKEMHNGAIAVATQLSIKAEQFGRFVDMPVEAWADGRRKVIEELINQLRRNTANGS